jgi:diacylglycerol kinase family enzyme
VLEKTERNKCLEDIQTEINDNDNETRKIIVIMGGDGSFATTIKFLRTSKDVDAGLNKGKLCFAVLPFGTGNDGA